MPIPRTGRVRSTSTTRQYARLVARWVSSIGLDPLKFATHSMRRTKVTLIYRRTGNLRAAQLLLGRTRIESTVRHLGVEVHTRLKSPKRSMSDVPGQTCRALPPALQGKRVPHEET